MHVQTKDLKDMQKKILIREINNISCLRYGILMTEPHLLFSETG